MDIGLIQSIVKSMIPQATDAQIEYATQQARRGEGLKERGFSDDMIELVKNISNEEKQDELFNKIIPSLPEFKDDPEFREAKGIYESECKGALWGYKTSDNCSQKLSEIKMLEMKQIRENYGRLLNNYYMTLAQYLVQCRYFESSCESETNCGLLQKSDLGSPGQYKKLWNDFVGEYTPKDEEGNQINLKELKEIYENIQLFSPLVLKEEKLPEEDDEYFGRRKGLISRVSQQCHKSDRLANLTMVIESRYELNKFIKSLGSFGNLLYLTLESGLFEVLETIVMGQGGGGKKRKSRKRKSRKKNKTRKKKKRSTKKSKKSKKRSKGKFRDQRGGELSSTDYKRIIYVILAIITIILFIIGGHLLITGLSALHSAMATSKAVVVATHLAATKPVAAKAATTAAKVAYYQSAEAAKLAATAQTNITHGIYAKAGALATKTKADDVRDQILAEQQQLEAGRGGPLRPLPPEDRLEVTPWSKESLEAKGFGASATRLKDKKDKTPQEQITYDVIIGRITEIEGGRQMTKLDEELREEERSKRMSERQQLLTPGSDRLGSETYGKPDNQFER